MEKVFSLRSFKLFLILFGLFQFILLPFYGMEWDEAAQQHLANATLDFISSKTSHITLLRADLFYYGSIFEIVNKFIASVALAIGFSFVDAYHVGILIFALIGVWFFYLLVKDLWSERVALAATFFLLFMPRFLAHAHYNSKDIIISTGTVISLYFLHKAFKNTTRKSLLMAGFIFGLTLAIQTTTLLILPIFFIPYYLANSISKRNILISVIALFIAAITVFIFWPAMWQDPNVFIHSFEYFSHHGWQGNVLYFGKVYLPTQLPWHYTLFYLFGTTPIITLGLLVVGILKTGKSFSKRHFPSLLLLTWLLLPIFITFKPGLAQYDGVRHFLWVYPSIAAFAGIGAVTILGDIKNNQTKIIASLIVIAWLSFQAYEIFPYQDVYFNEIVRAFFPSHIEQSFDFEYWGVSYREGVNWINQNASSSANVCVPFADHLLQFYPVRQDITFVCSKNANYLMLMERKTYIPSNLDEVYRYTKLKPVYSITRYNSDLLNIYKLR